MSLYVRQVPLIAPFQPLAEGYRMPIRVLVADDHAVVRLGVRKLIELLGGGSAETVPVSENRQLIVVNKLGPTPQRLPRRPGVAGKRPLA